MSGAAFLALAAQVALGLLALALLLALLRLVRGPSLADRVLALDLMTTLGLAFVAALAIATGFTGYIDIALAIGLVGFLATVALARFILVGAKPAPTSSDADEAAS